jgi:hypothetical protein
MTIAIARALMIGKSLIGTPMAEKEGYGLVLLISFVALPIRGAAANTGPAAVLAGAR